MAKSKDTSPDAALLDGLRVALVALPDGLPLRGAKGKAIFPTGPKGDEPARAAVADGFLIRREVTTGTGKRAKVVEHFVLTEAGVQRVLGADSVRPVLESLRPAVEKLAGGPAADPAAFRSEVEAASQACVRAVHEAFGLLQQTMQKALSATAGPANAGAVLTALTAALEKVEAPPPLPAAAAAPIPAKSTKDLDREVVEFVDGWAREKTVGCQFDVLMDHLRARHPDLTVGEFHDTLRRLDEANRVRLGGWNGSVHDLADPSLALFLSYKVMYYVHPAHRDA